MPTNTNELLRQIRFSITHELSATDWDELLQAIDSAIAGQSAAEPMRTADLSANTRSGNRSESPNPNYWTTNQPVVSGQYWAYTGHVVVPVYVDGTHRTISAFEPHKLLQAADITHWLGPMQVPNPPTD